MGRQTIDGFHSILANFLVSAKRCYDGRPKPGEPGYLSQDSQNAVTVWRRTAHLASGYANGAAVRGIRPTWEAFWVDGIDRAGMLALLAERSRFNRCAPDGSAPLTDDSIIAWEDDLARSLVWTHDLTTKVRERRSDRETVQRVDLDHEVTAQVAVAYTGVGLVDLRRTVADCKGREPVCWAGNRYETDHPVLRMITDNRPVR